MGQELKRQIIAESVEIFDVTLRGIERGDTITLKVIDLLPTEERTVADMRNLDRKTELV